MPPLAFRIIINQVLVPPAGHTPDLHALYFALAITSAALDPVESRDLRSNVHDGVERSAPRRALARAPVRPAAATCRSTSSTMAARRTDRALRTDLQMMIDAVSVSVPQLVVALATFISSFATMIYLDWLLTLSLFSSRRSSRSPFRGFNG